MKTCTFFGHRNCFAPDIDKKVENAIEKMILHEGVTRFLVGDSGNFDAVVYRAIKKMKEKYPQIDYAVVISYLRSKNDPTAPSPSETLFPDGIESVPKKFAISYRGKWMVEKSDYVIAYVTHDYGGAAQFVRLAERKGKTVINLTKSD